MTNCILDFYRRKNGHHFKTYVVLLALVALSTVFVSCKKDKLKSNFASLLQHKWTLKSTSNRDITIGSYVGPWSTTQAAPGLYREYKSNGTWIVTAPGFSYTGTYELMSDSIILMLNPATISTPYAPPDTSFIRQINESFFVSYYRKTFTSPNYSTRNETIDTLIR